MVVVKRKRFFEQYDTLLKRPVTLTVQVWDNDALSSDEFLGKRPSAARPLGSIVAWAYFNCKLVGASRARRFRIDAAHRLSDAGAQGGRLSTADRRAAEAQVCGAGESVPAAAFGAWLDPGPGYAEERQDRSDGRSGLTL